MKSKIALIVLTLLFADVASSQEINKSDITTFKIKSVTTIDSEGKIKYIEFFNEKGDLIKQGAPSNDGQFQISRELFYNDSAMLIEERTYTSNGEINSSRKYYYNNKNQLEKKELVTSGPTEALWIFEYDKNGNKITERQKSETMGNKITKYKYDINNFLIREDKSSAAIGKEERVIYKYSDKRQLIEKEIKSYYFNTTITVTFFYTDAGKLIKQEEKSSNGVSSVTIYNYDDHGLLISETWESSMRKTPQKTSYRINLE